MVKNKKILLIFFFAAVAALGWYKFNQPARICGNKICEPFEGPENCCLDCHCLSGWICDKESKKCQKIEMKLSDKRAKELAISSLQNRGKQVEKIEVLGVGRAFGKLIKKIKIDTLSGEVYYLGITEEEKVITLPFF